MVVVLTVCLRSTVSVRRSSVERRWWKRERNNDRASQRGSHRCTSQGPNTFVGRIPPPPQLGRADPLGHPLTLRPLLDDYGPCSLEAAQPKLKSNMLLPLPGSPVYARPSKWTVTNSKQYNIQHSAGRLPTSSATPAFIKASDWRSL